jgi:hypothetical protein
MQLHVAASYSFALAPFRPFRPPQPLVRSCRDHTKLSITPRRVDPYGLGVGDWILRRLGLSHGTMSDAATPNNSSIPNGNAKQSGDTAPTSAAVPHQLPLNALQAVMLGGGPFPQGNTAQPQQQYPLRVARKWEASSTHLSDEWCCHRALA